MSCAIPSAHHPPDGRIDSLLNSDDPVDTMITIMDFTGVFAFSYMGSGMALRRRYNPVGLFACGFLSALGGGSVREIILGRIPFYFFDQRYFVVVLCATLLARLTHRHAALLERLALPLDAVGLVAFAFIGARVAYGANLGLAGAVSFAVLTATGGGAIADAVSGRVPAIFRDGAYAIPPILLGAAYWALGTLAVINSSTSSTLLTVTFIVRLLAVYKHGVRWWWRKVRRRRGGPALGAPGMEPCAQTELCPLRDTDRRAIDSRISRPSGGAPLPPFGLARSNARHANQHLMDGPTQKLPRAQTAGARPRSAPVWSAASHPPARHNHPVRAPGLGHSITSGADAGCLTPSGPARTTPRNAHNGDKPPPHRAPPKPPASTLPIERSEKPADSQTRR